MLLIFGGAAVAGTRHALTDAYPVIWFPVNLLDYAEQVAFGVFFYVFPDGRFVPRWLALAVALLFVPTIFFPDSSLSLFSLPLFVGFLGTLMLAQVYRYARVSSPAQRQQTKWVVFGFAVALTGFVGLISLGNLVLDIPQAGSLGEIIASTFIYGFLLLIPLSIGMAILRSRLYDIDVVINRTLVYGSHRYAGARLLRGRNGNPGDLPSTHRPGAAAATGHRSLNPGHRCAVQPAAPAGAGLHRPPFLPQEVRRAKDACGLQ